MVIISQGGTVMAQNGLDCSLDRSGLRREFLHFFEDRGRKKDKINRPNQNSSTQPTAVAPLCRCNNC